MSKVSKKNIAFITPEFFGIEKSLINAMEAEGHKVLWFDERSVKSSFARAINSVSSIFFRQYSERYYKKIISSISIQLDFIIIVKGEMVSEKTIKRFRETFPKAELILYLWDPIKNIKGILPKIKLYDRVISFEPKDCKKYGLEFRPLFTDIEKKDGEFQTQSKDKYKISFYGTMYGDRFYIVYLMREYCKRNNISFYSFCYLRGKFMSLYYYITNKGFRKLGKDSISFKAKTSSEISEILDSTEIILDVNDKYQEGLTLRTLETLYNGKKMITTNADIINYDFYNKKNILVIKRNEIVIPKEFLNSKYESIPNEVLEKYTAKGWVKDVIK